MLSRRKLFTALCAIVVGSQVPSFLPTEAESKGTILEIPQPDYTLDLRVQNVGDRLSEDFYADGHLITKALANMKRFFDHYGFEVDITCFRAGGFRDIEGLGKDKGLFVYTTKEALLADPERFIRQNPPVEFEKAVRSEAKVYSATNNLSYEDILPRVRAAFVKQATDYYRKDIMNKNAITNPDEHITYLFPGNNFSELTDEQLVNRASVIFTHELGHLMGLQHPTAEDFHQRLYGFNNIMIGDLDGRHADVLDFKMHQFQQRAIKEYLDR